MKKALITGVAGQDGSYLAELLLEKGYEVHGLVRGGAFEKFKPRLRRISHILDKITLHHGDVTDYPTMWRLIARIAPDEVYHLAGLIKIEVSFKDDFDTFRTNTDSTHYLLSAIKELKPDCKFFFAGTAEQFGSPAVSPQNEELPFLSRTPYGISKTAAFSLVRMHREVYKMFACTGILFNHISPRIDTEFLPRKITMAAAKIKLGMEKELRLGNIETKRDWGFAGDYVEAMWRMFQHENPTDYVIGTGEVHSVREVVEEVFRYFDLDWKAHVVIDQKFFRPAEVLEWRADIGKIRKELGWSPKTTFGDIVKLMAKTDLENAKAEVAAL